MEEGIKFRVLAPVMGFLLALMAVNGLHAQSDTLPVLKLDTLSEHISLKPYLFYWVDESETVSHEEVVNRLADFSRLDSVSTDTDANAVYWLVMRIDCHLEKASDWMLQMGYTNFAEVYISSDTGYVLKKAGLYCPHSEKDVHMAETEKVQIHLSPGTATTIWIRVQEIDHSPPNLNFQLLELTYWKTISREVAHVIIGIFQGMVLIIILYNLILFFTTRLWPHLYYALYLISVSLFVLYATRVLQVLPTEYPKIVPHIGFLSLALLSIFYFQFGRSFLNTKRLIPVWDRYLKGYILFKIAVLIAEQAILFWTFYLEIVKDIEFGMILLDAVIAVFLIIRLVKAKSFLARFFIAGSSCVMVFALVLTVLGNVLNIADSFLFFSDSSGGRNPNFFH